MNSHFYLFRTSLKNQVKELLHKPGKLALYLLVIAAIAAGLSATLSRSAQADSTMPLYYFSPIFFAFLLLFYGMAIQKGLSSGDAIFDMSDVNLLFVSPVNPRATLLYGLIRLVGMSFWAGFFIMFQGSTLSLFGVRFSGILILFATFILNTVVLTILSLVIYSVTNGNPARKRIVKILAVVVFIPLLALFAFRLAGTGDWLLALEAVIKSTIFAVTPIIGWATAGAIALIEGELLAGFGWLGLLALTGAGMLIYIMYSRSDYYEDVLVATETAFEKRRAAAEGDIQSAGATTAKVKVTRTGLNGLGARVFLYKHLRETFRQNPFGFLSLHMLITAVAILGVSFFARGKIDIFLILQVLMWMQVFLIGTGRGLLETYLHYIYMIPGSAFKKLIWSNMELMLRELVESVLLLGIPGLVMGGHPLVVLGSMAVYVFFSFMLLGINYLFMLLLEANLSKGILIVVYLLAVLLFLAPGLAAALIVGFEVGGLAGELLGLTILSAWELLAGIVCFALSRNVLRNCDMPSAKR